MIYKSTYIAVCLYSFMSAVATAFRFCFDPESFWRHLVFGSVPDPRFPPPASAPSPGRRRPHTSVPGWASDILIILQMFLELQI